MISLGMKSSVISIWSADFSFPFPLTVNNVFTGSRDIFVDILGTLLFDLPLLETGSTIGMRLTSWYYYENFHLHKPRDCIILTVI